MSTLRIYGIARTRAFRVLWIAKELDLDYEHIPLEIGAAGAGKPDYLAKKHGRLYPKTLEGEAKAWQWSLWSVQEVDRGVNIWSLHAVRLPPADRDPQRLAEALKVLERPLKVLDGALAAAPTFWARTSPSPISTSPRSSAGRSTWICPRRRALGIGSSAASTVRRRARRRPCGRRPTRRLRSR